jgi:hypothetical protein
LRERVEEFCLVELYTSELHQKQYADLVVEANIKKFVQVDKVGKTDKVTLGWLYIDHLFMCIMLRGSETYHNIQATKFIPSILTGLLISDLESHFIVLIQHESF